jgi:hypothetical protein
MTTASNQGSQAQGMPSWAMWLFGIAAVILFIWLWNTASSAKSIAEQNAAQLAQPELEAAYLVGGPTRFAEQFTEAVEDAEIEGFDSADFVWATAVVTNEGTVDANDVTLTAELPGAEAPTVLAALPSFGLDLDVSQEDGSLEVDLRDIDEGETALVFLGFGRDNLPEGQASTWTQSFETTLDRMTVEAGDTTEVVYGRGV